MIRFIRRSFPFGDQSVVGRRPVNGDRARSGRGNPTARRTPEREKRRTCQIVRDGRRIHHLADAAVWLMGSDAP
jgi:hypothetical protein